MARKETAQKLIVVESVGSIPELGGISGPVLSPCYVPIETINLMLNHHRKVYEVNPKNYKEKVALSLRNLRKQNFVVEATQTKAKMAPTIHTQPIVRNSNEVTSGPTKDFTDNVMVVTKVAPSKPKKVENKVETKVEQPEPEKKTETPTSDFVKND